MADVLRDRALSSKDMSTSGSREEAGPLYPECSGVRVGNRGIWIEGWVGGAAGTDGFWSGTPAKGFPMLGCFSTLRLTKPCESLLSSLTLMASWEWPVAANFLCNGLSLGWTVWNPKKFGGSTLFGSSVS